MTVVLERMDSMKQIVLSAKRIAPVVVGVMFMMAIGCTKQEPASSAKRSADQTAQKSEDNVSATAAVAEPREAVTNPAVADNAATVDNDHASADDDDHAAAVNNEPAAAVNNEPAAAVNNEPANDPADAPADAPAAAPAKETYDEKRKKIDYNQRNGRIFENWPKPKLAVVLSGAMDGYIEPCGCTGLENQKGGLKRRHAMIQGLKQDGWTVVALDIGGMVRRLGPQAAAKYRHTIGGLRTIGYDAIGLGSGELKLPGEELLRAFAEHGSVPFVSANVSHADFEDFGFRVKYKVVEAAGMRIGVTTVVGKDRSSQLQNSEFQIADADTALAEVLKLLAAENCDQLILLADASVDEAKQLAVRFPKFDFVVAASVGEPPDEAVAVKGTRTRLIEVSEKAMYFGVIGFFDNAKVPVRYQRVPLDGRFPDTKEMTQLMADYQQELKQAGLEGLGLHPIAHPTGRTFVGSQTCADCHEDEYEIWKKSPHAHAMETLIKLSPQRHFDPECLSCHVTGWEPQEYYPFKAGYLSLEKTPAMIDNGCENCHGPGSQHVAGENGDIDADEAMLEKFRAAMRLTVAEAKKNDCARCHDVDNSPDFKFDKYWPPIEH
jgi:hypothetical protein